MNKDQILNTVISATAGGILGGAITYLTVKKTIEARANAEIEEVKTRFAILRKEEPSTVVNYYSKTDEIGAEKAREIIKQMSYLTTTSGNPGDDPEDEPEEDVHPSAQTLSVFDIEVPVDENGVPIPEEDEDDGYEDDEDEDDEDEDEVSDEDAYVKVDGEPYLIDINDFFNNNDEFDKITLSYYEDDDVLTEMDEHIIDNVNEVVGTRHLHMFGENEQDESTVYVRNEEIHTDYEINLVHGSYSSIVLGVREEMLDVKARKKSPGRMRDED